MVMLQDDTRVEHELVVEKKKTVSALTGLDVKVCHDG
jgi:hypothetical protein